MNETEFQEKLRERTDATPIPDSLSPDHIKEHLQAPKPKRKWYRRPWVGVAAACLLLGIVTAGVVTVPLLRHPLYGNSENDSLSPNADSDMQTDAADQSNDSDSYRDINDDDILHDKGTIASADSYRQLYRMAKDHAFNDLAYNVEVVTGDDALPESAESVQHGAADDSASDSYYDTNSQVATVAEADIVKTDGQYLYSAFRESGSTLNAVAIAKTKNGSLTACSVITPAQDLSDSIVSGNSELQLKELYIYDQTLILLCYTDNQTQVVLYDVSNPKKPSFIRSLSQSGAYVSSRLADGYLYTFTDRLMASPNRYRAFSDYLPYAEQQPLACDDIYLPDYTESYRYQIITGLDINDSSHFISTKAILADSNTYYVSDSNIYFAVEKWAGVGTNTELLKFSYTDGQITPQGSVTFDGSLLNQFSLDEYQGYLRLVATVYNYGSTTGTTNALYIIDSDMNLVGCIDELAPTEQIYSARFMGDTGYFVTYRNMDPLFSVDLSDPENPKVMDALKIPGFSSYLHFYSDHLLLGLGKEIDPTTGEFLGLKLSMFDISDPYHIVEIDKAVLPEAQYSPALDNHKALMIDPKKNLIGFYVESYDTVNYDYQEEYRIYSYTDGSGFEKKFTCRINEDPILSYDTAYSSTNDRIRGLYIGNYLYLVNGSAICSYSLTDYQPVEGVIVRGDGQTEHTRY